jgi:hypothetical protein
MQLCVAVQAEQKLYLSAIRQLQGKRACLRTHSENMYVIPTQNPTYNRIYKNYYKSLSYQE